MSLYSLFCRRIPRSIIYRWDKFIVPRHLKGLGVECAGESQFVGAPEVSLAIESTIRIGEKGLFVSRNFSTALGVSHPIVWRTLLDGARIEIGSHVGMSGGTICAAKSVTIGRDCLLGADVIVADTDFHPLEPLLRHNSQVALRNARPVAIGNNVFIGTRSIVLKGVSIGDNTVIGAGSVVTKSLPANVIAGGNPCRVIRELPSDSI